MERLACPACRRLLSVRRGQRAGTCSGCGAAIAVRRRSMHNPARRPLPAAAAQAKRDYETFHGTPPTRISRRQIKLPKVAYLVGDVKDLTYIPPENSERAKDEDGRPVEYVHCMKDGGVGIDWGTRPRLYASADRKQFLLIGGSVRMDPNRGLVW